MNQYIIIISLLLASIVFVPSVASLESINKSNSATLSLEYKGYFSKQERKKMRRWLVEMVGAVNTIYGQFPLKQANILLVRSYSITGPVPWGQVDREYDSRVTLHVNPSYSYQTLLDDWTAVHELSHLLLPYAGGRDRWFSEGIASYYQNVARANAGLLSEQTAWKKLYQGFQRGERNSLRRKVPLALASNRGGNSMRVYWSGAAYFLLVDLDLRQQTNGKQSLASVLKQYKYCCLPNHRVTPALKIIEKLDQLSKTSVFSDNYREIINSESFPDYRRAFVELGIKTRWGRVEFSDDLDKQAVRRQIIKAL